MYYVRTLFSTNFKHPSNSNSVNKFFNFSEGDFNDLTSLYNSSDVEEIWYILRSNILTGIELFVPKIRLHSRQFPNWFTPPTMSFPQVSTYT